MHATLSGGHDTALIFSSEMADALAKGGFLGHDARVTKRVPFLLKPFLARIFVASARGESVQFGFRVVFASG